MLVVALAPLVFDPFNHVAGHVIESEGIGTLGLDRMGAVAGVRAVPGVFAQLRFIVGAGPFELFSARARGEFPFGLGRQAILAGGHDVQPPDVFLGVVPGDVFQRAVIAAVFEMGGIVSHERLPLALGDLVRAKVIIIDAGFV